MSAEATSTRGKLLKFTEAAQRLNTSLQQVYRLVYRGDLKRVPVGKQWRIPEEEIEAHINRNTADAA